MEVTKGSYEGNNTPKIWTRKDDYTDRRATLDKVVSVVTDLVFTETK